MVKSDCARSRAPEEKRCGKCGEVKPLEAFNRDRRNSRDGLQFWCRQCQGADRKAYFEANKETEVARKKAYRESNKEGIAAKKKVYRTANKEGIATKQKVYYEVNKEVYVARSKAWYEANKEVADARHKVYYKKCRATNVAFLESTRPLKCEACGYDRCFEALEFHHTDPSQKEHARDCMGVWLSFSTTRFKAKVNAHQFIILCSNCHRELHANENSNQEEPHARLRD